MIKIGEYVLQNKLLLEENEILEVIEKAIAIKESIMEDKRKILEIKNIQICFNCGTEVAKSSKFCDKCGTELLKVELKLEQKKCLNCGQILDENAVFCAECGTKQEADINA